MKLGLKEMKKEYKKVDIDEIEVGVNFGWYAWRHENFSQFALVL